MKKPRKGLKAPQPDPNAWMVTFSDLLMLMLTFFVLLLSMSSLDQQSVRDIVRPGLSDTGGPQQSRSVPIDLIPPVVPRISHTRLQEAWVEYLRASDFEGLEEIMQDVFIHTRLNGRAWVERRPDGLRINIDGQVAFQPGTAELTASSRALLQEVIDLVGLVDGELLVEAYLTDDAGNDLGTEENWDLALRRADRVAVFATRGGVDRGSLRVMGYGYAAGRDEMAFARQRQLLRLTLREPDRNG